jgi:Protein of unknown function (DUF1203)
VRYHDLQPIRILAIPTAVAEEVRSTMRAPRYGFPAHAEVGSDSAPCRHCLRSIDPGKPGRILFTHDRFAGVEQLPQPGPVYIHAEPCTRYEEDAGFPEELRGSPRTLEAYARGRRLLAQEHVSDGKFEPVIEKLFAQPEVDYIQVNSTTAGCFTFRIERGNRPEVGAQKTT